MIQDNLFRQQKPAETKPTLATVASVEADGVTLIVDGETAASQMVCVCLASYTPTAGDRVLFQRVGGTMLVLGKVG